MYSTVQGKIRDGPLTLILCDIDTALQCVSSVDFGSVCIDLIQLLNVYRYQLYSIEVILCYVDTAPKCVSFTKCGNGLCVLIQH